MDKSEQLLIFVHINCDAAPHTVMSQFMCSIISWTKCFFLVMSNWIWYDLTNQLHCVDFGKHLKPKGVKCVGNSTSTYKNIDLDLVVQETVIFWSGLCSTLTNDAEVLPLSCIWLTTNSNVNLFSIHRLPMSVSLWLKKPDQLDFPSSLTQVHIMPIFFLSMIDDDTAMSRMIWTCLYLTDLKS